jgi:Cof subfamily protein (haloacid dehalogenase superfamily)
VTAPARALLATDLDGTLLRADGSISRRTREALARARESQVEVVFVTGRPPLLVPPIVAATQHRGPVICANGSVVLDASSLEPTRVDAFPADHVRQLLARLVATMPGDEYRTMMHRPGEPSRRVIGEGPGYPERIEAHLAAGWQVFKFAVIGRSQITPDSFLASAAEAFGRLGEVTHSSYGVPLVEIGPIGVTKGTALADHAASLGVALADVHAVGDMPNDLPMLAVAGRSYAVANGHREVRKAVDEVLPSNAEDGVATLIERLVE